MSSTNCTHLIEIAKDSHIVKELIYDVLTTPFHNRKSRFNSMFQVHKDNAKVCNYLRILIRKMHDTNNLSDEMNRQFIGICQYFEGLPDVKLSSTDFANQAKLIFDKHLREEHQRYEGIYLMLKDYPSSINLGTGDTFVNRLVPTLAKVMGLLDCSTVGKKELHFSSMTIEDVMEVAILEDMTRKDKIVVKKVREMMLVNNIKIDLFDKHFPLEKSNEEQIADVIAKMKQLCVAKDFEQLSCLNQELIKLLREPKESIMDLIYEVEKIRIDSNDPRIKKIVAILKKMNE